MATKTLRFTKASIDAIIPPAKGRDVYRDDENRYLHLFVTPTSKAFYVIRKVRGKVKFLKLGRHPDFTIAEARNGCGELCAKIARGEEPNRPKADRMKFAELFDRYMAGHAQPHKRTWAEDRRMHNKLFAGLDGKTLVEIDREMVTKLHKRLREDHGLYAANRVLSLLKVVFSYGRDTLEIDMPNPCVKVKPFTETARERFLNGGELKVFFDTLDDEETLPEWRDFFRLALFTGARRANVQSMKWEDVDLTAALWTIAGEETKNGEPLRLPLTEPAVDILTRRKAAAGESAYVFPSCRRCKGGHIVEPRKAWRAICTRAGLKDLRIHDLRRTLGSWQAATGASLQVIGKSLGHRNQRTTEIYARMNLDPVKLALSTATDAMMKAINGQGSTEAAQ